jgi:hypothetical protein
VDFATAAGRYCSVIEDTRGRPLNVWLLDVERTLSALYSAAAGLPEADPATDKPINSTMSSEEWESLYERLRDRLGSVDLYWEIFDVGNQHSLVQASLADDLVDVYRDVRRGLKASRSGAPPDDVLFEWRSGFEIHWAEHALGALRAVRSLLSADSAP